MQIRSYLRILLVGTEKNSCVALEIAFPVQVDFSLNLDQLKEKINFLKHTESIKKTMCALSYHSDAVVNNKKGKRNMVPLDNIVKA